MRRCKSTDQVGHPTDRRPTIVGELPEQSEAFKEFGPPVDQILRRQTAGEVAQDPAERAQRGGIRIGLKPASTVAELRDEPESDQASLDPECLLTQCIGERVS